MFISNVIYQYVLIKISIYFLITVLSLNLSAHILVQLFMARVCYATSELKTTVTRYFHPSPVGRLGGLNINWISSLYFMPSKDQYLCWIL